MSPPTPDSLARLRAANPARVDEDSGRSVVAQAALQRILADHRSTIAPPRRRMRFRLGVVLAALLVMAGGATAATDPFGWWSPNADSARYRVNPAVHVQTPSAMEITCRSGPRGGFRCAFKGSGQRYSKIDAIPPPAPSSAYSREQFTKTIGQQLAAGKMTAAQAARFRADLARVPDTFFSELRLASRFATYSGGGTTGANQRERVPPAGIPEFLICENAGPALRCQDLNGDEHAPIGAGVYQAQPASDWRAAPSHRRASFLPAGITFTPAEYRLLVDTIKTATTSTSSSGGSAK